MADTEIPICVPNGDEAIAVLQAQHKKWIAAGPSASGARSAGGSPAGSSAQPRTGH
jgi:hypothetical protein